MDAPWVHLYFEIPFMDKLGMPVSVIVKYFIFKWRY